MSGSPAVSCRLAVPGGGISPQTNTSALSLRRLASATWLMVTPPSAWPTSTTGSSILSRSREIFSTLSASVTWAGGVWSLPSPGRSGAWAVWPRACRIGTTFSQHQPPWHAPWTSTKVAMPRSAPADDGARAGRGHEEVGQQLGPRRDGVFVEIGHAFGGQHLVVDEEVAGAAPGW